jgi:flagellar motor switch protein FliG
MGDMPPPAREDVMYVMGDFINVARQSGLGIDPSSFSRDLVQEALGEQSLGNVIDKNALAARLRALESLRWMHPDSVASLLRHEHPQTVAIVLAYLEPEQSAAIMASLPAFLRDEAIIRLSSLQNIPPQALVDINDALDAETSGDTDNQLTSLGGVDLAAEILNYASGGWDKDVLNVIGEQDKDLRLAIEEKMFVFDDLIRIDDRGFQRIMREVENPVLVVALKGADTMLKEKFIANMSKRAAEALLEEMEIAPPVKLSEVDEAQKKILQVTKALADSGEIVIPSTGGEEYV